MSKKISITTFTDPMMGLSYECEPIFRKLETHFGENIHFKYNMCVLVKNVYDFVDPSDLEVSKELALENYNRRLAEIYKTEEGLMQMPICMEGFQLFSTRHTSSLPLNLAYKTAQLIDAAKADLLLYNLRYATIVDCRPTTHLDEILKVVRKTGIDEEKFLQHFKTDSMDELEKDLRFAQKLDIHSLPAYLVEYDGNGALFQELLGYNAFVQLIDKLTDGGIKPKNFERTLNNLRGVLKSHPVISPIEIREAFDFENLDEVKKFIAPLIDSKEIVTEQVHHGYFIKTNFEMEHN